MCGIAGFVDANAQNSRYILERMTRALEHRGPDGEGYFVDSLEGVYLGHRRLSIVDLSDGEQPMMTMDGNLIIVFNGAIYNHLDLRIALETKGNIFKTHHSDTETLLIGYREWGESVLERINGMFACAIFDKTRKRIFIARDRFGEKPLYWFKRGSVFAFASELGALLCHPAAPRNESMIALKKYFSYGYIPAPHSIISGISKLPAGWSGILNISDDTLVLRKWWEFCLEPSNEKPTKKQCEIWAEELLHRLDHAVKRQLVTEVPFGVFLSGGIDSSAIATLSANHCSTEKLQTFSLGFTDPSFDELSYSRQFSNCKGWDNQSEVFDPSTVCELIGNLLAKLDEPMGDASILPTWLLCGLARKNVTVVLGGDGGDELFAGYDPLRALAVSKLYDQCIPRAIHPAIKFLASWLPVSHSNMSLDFKIKRTLRGLSYDESLRIPVWMGPLEPKTIDDYFGDHTPPEELLSEAIDAWESAGNHAPGLDRALQFFTRIYLQNDIMTKVDRASMLHGLEVRSPFLDLEIVNFARKLPHSVKLRNGTTKWILKKALERLLPHSILYRSKKGFGMPLGFLFYEGSIAPEIPQDRCGVLVSKALHDHQSGIADEKIFLWCQHVLNRWRRARSE